MSYRGLREFTTVADVLKAFARRHLNVLVPVEYEVSKISVLFTCRPKYQNFVADAKITTMKLLSVYRIHCHEGRQIYKWQFVFAWCVKLLSVTAAVKWLGGPWTRQCSAPAQWRWRRSERRRRSAAACLLRPCTSDPLRHRQLNATLRSAFESHLPRRLPIGIPNSRSLQQQTNRHRHTNYRCLLTLAHTSGKILSWLTGFRDEQQKLVKGVEHWTLALPWQIGTLRATESWYE